jgi:hypothetical protein
MAGRDFRPEGRLPRIGVVVLVTSLTVGVAHAQSEASATGVPEPSLITRDAASITFPRNYWSPEYRATLVAIEFLKSDWEPNINLAPPPSDPSQLLEEIRYLHSLTRLRDERREEIKAQADQFVSYFFPILMMHQYSHPRTYELVSVSSGLTDFIYVFKARFNRARPSQLSPSLQPMIIVPGHPAYPSGHGFQGRLMALLLAEVRPDARAELIAMGDRIAFNREIAGLHYPSDTKAGQSLAEQVLALMKRTPRFQELLADAKAEWR